VERGSLPAGGCRGRLAGTSGDAPGEHVPSHVTEPPGVAAELSGAEPGAQAEPQGAEPLDWAVIASQLGEFLAALHQPAPADAPVNLVRGDRVRITSEFVAIN
jgi:hypothetical protein